MFIAATPVGANSIILVFQLSPLYDKTLFRASYETLTFVHIYITVFTYFSKSSKVANDAYSFEPLANSMNYHNCRDSRDL